MVLDQWEMQANGSMLSGHPQVDNSERQPVDFSGGPSGIILHSSNLKITLSFWIFPSIHPTFPATSLLFPGIIFQMNTYKKDLRSSATLGTIQAKAII